MIADDRADDPSTERSSSDDSRSEDHEVSAHDVAVIGMAGRFPGAANPDELWANVRAGVESIRQWTEEELIANGVSEALRSNPDFVGANGPLEGYRDFDADFFGLGPKEAAIMDPQHRQLLEVAWETLESAGHPPERFDGDIGVFAGCGMGAYFLYNVMANDALVDAEGVFLLRHTGNDKDFLATRVSYALNLTGPSVSVQTACSTSMVAIHQAVQSLTNLECDMALAGGVTIEIPHGHGYVYHEGEVLAPDGHCRAFDHRGRGTVFGSGAGMVALRRLSDAVDDGDRILAVIRGSAVNNDGAGKISYMAPSVDGQAAAIAEALAVADVDPSQVGYVETHGTGTAVGDPIEVAALNQAFGAAGGPGSIAIGSIKPNIGHLDTAAGVASFIKLVQAIRHRELPPSINYEAPNPVIDFGSGPFYVNDELRPWPDDGRPVIGGVSSLGVGGTNAHVVVESAPEPAHAPSPRSAAVRRAQLLMVSGRTSEAVDGNTERLADHLEALEGGEDLAEIAWNLHATRRGFSHRRTLVALSNEDAVSTLRSGDATSMPTREVYSERASVAFLFPGGGAHHPSMARGLHAHEPEFARHVDAGLARLREVHDIDLAPALFCDGDANGTPEQAAAFAEAEALLEAPHRQLPAIFLVEYALGKLYESWGIVPRAMAGHSLGENTAACLAGVMSFEDCLDLVVVRGAMMERAGAGGVLSVNLAAVDVEPYLSGNLVIASINAPTLTAVSGTVDEIAELSARLESEGIDARIVPFAYPVHSPLFDPHLGEFEARVRAMDLKPPTIPIASNLTGTWLSVGEATDPAYWVRQVRHTVRFDDCASLLLQEEGTVLVEVGPGTTLSAFARQNDSLRPGQPVIASLRRPDQCDIDDDLHLLGTVGRIWSAGVELDADLFHGGPRRRIALPTYAFTHREYFIEPGQRRDGAAGSGVLRRSDQVQEWFHRAVWHEDPVDPAPAAMERSRWLVFIDESDFGLRLCERLIADGHDVVTVREGNRFERHDPNRYLLAPEMGREGYDRLIEGLIDDDRLPDRVVHLWSLSTDLSVRPGSSWFHHQQERGFLSLVHLAQATGSQLPDIEQAWTVVTNGSQAVRGAVEHPEKATIMGPVGVIPRELRGVTVGLVDIDAGRPLTTQGRALAMIDRLRERVGAPADEAAPDPLQMLLADLASAEPSAVLAYRAGRRYRRSYDHAMPEARGTSLLRSGGTYLVTGGLGGIGMFLADRLGRNWGARLILVSRTPTPASEEWDEWLGSHGPDNAVSRRIRKLAALRQAGVEFMVAEADVADIEQMSAVVDAAIGRYGRIDGVIHAAGLVDDGLIQMKTEADLDRVLTPKVQGALVLDEVMAPHRPDFIVSFSSTSAALGLPGQVDYAAANAFLDAYAQRPRLAGDPRRISLAWGPWRSIGMAASLASDDVDAGEFTRAMVPLLDFVARGENVAVATTELSTDRMWLLDEHRSESGRALLPGTGHIELLAEAAQLVIEGPSQITGLTFVAPLVVADEVVRDCRVMLESGAGTWLASVQSRSLGSSGRWETHSQASLSPIGTPTPDPVDLAAITARCQVSVTTNDAGIATRQEDHVRFGPRWRCLRELRVGEGEALGLLHLGDEFSGDVDQHLVHAALADIGTGFGLTLVDGYDELDEPPLYVPLSYGAARLHAPLERDIASHLRLRETSAHGAMVRFDVTLCAPDGRVLVDIEDFAMVRTDGAAFGEVDGANRVEVISAGLAPDVLFERFLEAGIEPDDGWDAFQRVLASDAEHVLVSPLPIAEQKVMIGQALAHSDGGARFARPSLGSDYVAAETEVETALVAIWEELLGVDPVGIHDDFFELGGHSLVALRLVAMIKARFGVDHPMSVLFDAPTISALAPMLGEDTNAGAGAAVTSITARLGLRHLVEMAPDTGDGNPPLFLVAGMFGNILNLRHLALLVGRDRAVYGIQALGLREGEEPHRRFEEMAAAYIPEIQAVQPEGPYLLGGFSGGGVTAFEMAHQFEAAGHEIEAIIMLDSPRPGMGGEVSKVDKAMRHWQDLRVHRHRYPLQWAKSRMAWERDKRRTAESLAAPTVDATAAIEAAFYDAVDHYESRYWDGVVHLYRPRLDKAYKISGDRYINEVSEFQLADNGWSGFARTVVVHEVPGTHDSMVLEPNVRALAARIVDDLVKTGAKTKP